MIPVRIPAQTLVPTAGGVKQIEFDSPLADEFCQVCDELLCAGVAAEVRLVVVGIAPEDRQERGWTTGAAVAVHRWCVEGVNRDVEESNDG